MSPKYYMRVSMAGWAFVAVVLLSLWSEGTDPVSLFKKLFVGADERILGAVAAAVAGLGVPPLLGFVLERVTSVLLVVVRLNLWQTYYSRDC